MKEITKFDGYARLNKARDDISIRIPNTIKDIVPVNKKIRVVIYEINEDLNKYKK